MCPHKVKCCKFRGLCDYFTVCGFFVSGYKIFPINSNALGLDLCDLCDMGSWWNGDLACFCLLVGLIVCRIEEEHLWEAKLLGAHSPHVLLHSLIYFNAKFFMLRTAEEHLALSAACISKHWRKIGVGVLGKPGRQMYLRYCPPGE